MPLELNQQMIDMEKDWIAYRGYGVGNEVNHTGWKNYFRNRPIAVGAREATYIGRCIAYAVLNGNEELAFLEPLGLDAGGILANDKNHNRYRIKWLPD